MDFGTQTTSPTYVDAAVQAIAEEIVQETMRAKKRPGPKPGTVPKVDKTTPEYVDKMKKYRREYYNKKYHEDPEYRDYSLRKRKELQQKKKDVVLQGILQVNPEQAIDITNQLKLDDDIIDQVVPSSD